MISNDWTAAVLKELTASKDSTPAFNVPPVLTHSAETFFHHQSGALSVLFGMLNASVFADNAAFVAGKILRGDSDLPKDFDPLVPLSQTHGPHLRLFRAVNRPLMEMILIRLADNLTTYLLDLIGECIRSRPGMLKSAKDQMSIEAILAFATLEELRASIIDRKLISIAYLSLDKQLDWISDNLGVVNGTQQGYFPTLLELVEARNCMVHNRAKIGAKYLKALAPFETTANAGQLIRPSIDDLFVAAKAASELVASLDGVLIAKFGLKAAVINSMNAD